jgi:hypothetical protein
VSPPVVLFERSDPVPAGQQREKTIWQIAKETTMNLNKKLLALGCVGILAGGPAVQADVISYTLDFDALSDSDHGGTSGPMERIQFDINTQTYQYVNNPDTPLEAGDIFVDRGYGDASAFRTQGSSAASQSGPSVLPSTYSMGLLWNELTGVVRSADTSGGNYVVQADYTGVDAAGFSIFVSDFDATSSGFGQDFNAAREFYQNGERVMQMDLRSGNAILEFASQGGDFIEGTFVFEFEVTDVLPGFWFTEDGEDFANLADAPPFLVNAFASAGTLQMPAPVTSFDGFTSPFGEAYEGQALFSQTLSSHDGSLRFTVPEPGTFALMGLALLLLGAFAYRPRRRDEEPEHLRAV